MIHDEVPGADVAHAHSPSSRPRRLSEPRKQCFFDGHRTRPSALSLRRRGRSRALHAPSTTTRQGEKTWAGIPVEAHHSARSRAAARNSGRHNTVTRAHDNRGPLLRKQLWIAKYGLTEAVTESKSNRKTLALLGEQAGKVSRFLTHWRGNTPQSRARRAEARRMPATARLSSQIAKLE